VFDHHADTQRRFAEEVVEQLRAAGYVAYWAGGCVRDRLLGRTPKDYDVATSAQPNEIRTVFGHRRTLAIGAAFGVISVLGKKPAQPIEVATFREDSSESDGRRPHSVVYSTPERDAQRRDFTVNGLFFDPTAQQVIDFVSGQDDLGRRIIRAIGQPRARFTEDKLRMLRAVRFATVLDFAIEPETFAAIGEMAKELPVVSAERIAGEMRGMLSHPHRAQAATLLQQTGLLAVVLPEITNRLTSEALPERWLSVLADLEADNFALALAALLSESLSPQESQAVCRRWKLSNADTERTVWLVTHRETLAKARTMYWPDLQRLLISPGIGDLLLLREAIAKSRGESLEEFAFCRQQLSRPPHELDPPLLLSGDDLLRMRVPAGPVYQKLLREVRDAQLLGKVQTSAEAAELAQQIWRREGNDE
jgi:tRNA nucleotidyltransferase/poly(A) polymerase